MRHLKRRLRTEIEEYAEVVKSLNILTWRIIKFVALITILVSEIFIIIRLVFY